MPRTGAYPIWSSFAPARAGGPPIQEQLVRFFRDAIAGGALKPGVRVPATRLLARELGLARNTVALAYERLVAEGFLEARQGAGTFVSAELPPQGRHPIKAAERDKPLGSRRALSLPPDRAASPPHWPLTPGLPALDAFPRALWSRLAARFWRRASSLLAYGEPAGYRPLREALAAYLGAARGIICQADNLIVTSGTQEAVFIAALALADAGETAWVEHPGYEATRQALTLAGLTVVGVPVDEEGLQVTEGQAQAPAARLALVAPSHHYPLGVVMSLPRRLALLQWARQSGAYILEDDYDSEFRYGGAPVTTLKALDGEGGRVVYIGTLGKLLAPGLRLGFLVAPDRLVEALRAVRLRLDRHVSLPLQAVTAEFIGNGHLGAHIRRLRPLYGERRAALLAAAEALDEPRLRLIGPATGLHVVAALDPERDDRAAAAAARARQLGVTALADYAVPQAPAPVPRGLLLGFGNTPATAMPGALRRLAESIARAAAAQPML